jgi:hypothetical protein
MSIDNLQLLVKKRFLRSASLSHSQTPNSDSYGALRYRTTPHPQTAIPTERFAIALPTPQQRFLRSASLSHPHPTSQKRFLRSASLSHPHPTSQKRFLRSASLSHPHIPNSDPLHTSPKAIPTERFAIASPHPRSDRSPHIPNSDRTSQHSRNSDRTSPHPQTAIVLPTPPKAN